MTELERMIRDLKEARARGDYWKAEQEHQSAKRQASEARVRELEAERDAVTKQLTSQMELASKAWQRVDSIALELLAVVNQRDDAKALAADSGEANRRALAEVEADVRTLTRHYKNYAHDCRHILPVTEGDIREGKLADDFATDLDGLQKKLRAALDSAQASAGAANREDADGGTQTAAVTTPAEAKAPLAGQAGGEEKP